MILVAGAGVPLSEAIAPDSWIAPVLGFLVVLGAGLERIFSRTTAAAVPLDVLRRELARERRLLVTLSDVYADSEDPHRLYVERVESWIASYDAKMIEYYEHQIDQQTRRPRVGDDEPA